MRARRRVTIYPNPAPPGDSVLNGITALAPNDLWAVGVYTATGTPHTLTVHGDGTSWTQVPSASPGDNYANWLSAVDGVSAGGAWAVGFWRRYSPQALIEACGIAGCGQVTNPTSGSPDASR